MGPNIAGEEGEARAEASVSSQMSEQPQLRESAAHSGLAS